MKGKTHIAIGLAATTVLLHTNQPTNMAINVVFATLGSLAPDIDTQESIISHKVNDFIFGGILLALFTKFVLHLSLISTLEKVMQLNFMKPSFLLIVGCIIVSKITPHRSFSHSILGIALFTIGIYLSFGQAFIPFLIGYVAHILADLCTNKGISLLYPFEKRIALHLTSTGSIMDYLICYSATMIFIYANYIESFK